MRRSDDMFGPENGAGPGFADISENTAVMIVCTVMSVLMAVFVAANFEEIASNIAVWAADILSTGIPILITVFAIIYFVMKFRWNMRRGFWGW